MHDDMRSDYDIRKIAGGIWTCITDNKEEYVEMKYEYHYIKVRMLIDCFVDNSLSRDRL